MKILVIEDDNNINNMITSLLKTNGYEVMQAFSGTEGLLIHDKSVDLILLDLMLPGKNGNEIITELKKTNNCPIIVMSAIGEVNTKLELFDLGAVDYIIKPFNNKELLARVRVHLDMKKSESNQVLSFKDIELSLDSYKVICNKKEVILTKNEFLILKALLEHKNQVLTKSALFDLVWDSEFSADDNTLNVHISRLRNKLKEANSKEDYIETVWSVGYRLK